MIHDFEMSAEQCVALGKWVEPGMAPVLICWQDDIIYAAQGDERMQWDAAGNEVEYKPAIQ